MPRVRTADARPAADNAAPGQVPSSAKASKVADDLRRIAAAAGDLHAILSTRSTAADVTASYATMLRRVAEHLMFYQARLRQKSPMICVEDEERQQLLSASGVVLDRLMKDVSHHHAAATKHRSERWQQFHELTSYLCRGLPKVMGINPKPLLYLIRPDGGRNVFSEATADPIADIMRPPQTEEDARVAIKVARALRFLGKVEVEASSRALMSGSVVAAEALERPPLRGNARLAAIIIVKARERMMGKTIAEKLGIPLGSFNSNVASVLKRHWGLLNEPSDGYYFPPDAPIHASLYDVINHELNS